MNLEEMERQQERMDKVIIFQNSLNDDDEWLFYHLAWARGEVNNITLEDKYMVMLRWDELKGDKK